MSRSSQTLFTRSSESCHPLLRCVSILCLCEPSQLLSHASPPYLSPLPFPFLSFPAFLPPSLPIMMFSLSLPQISCRSDGQTRTDQKCVHCWAPALWQGTCTLIWPAQLSCLGGSAGRASWVRVPPEAALLFLLEKKRVVFGRRCLDLPCLYD